MQGSPVGWSEERDGCWSMSEPDRCCGMCAHLRALAGVPRQAADAMRGRGVCDVPTPLGDMLLVHEGSELAMECDDYEEAEA